MTLVVRSGVTPAFYASGALAGELFATLPLPRPCLPLASHDGRILLGYP